ncbi:FecR family protein [Salinispira pacifica]|uniref:FecR protein domain-containing protein n=1 Tax=Salinispira pacifica TaxID=1307761 RepID=V5WLI5_9SPIO|nr:FecR domain-containing protein [Salinispira pacifica]AHC16792.1 hypothetical protein L21SP2_3456 [Salinispira pacifica]
MNRRKLFLLITILLITQSLWQVIWATDADIIFFDGSVDVKTAAGELIPADFGMRLKPGDVIITGLDGFCELEVGDGSVVTVQPDTAFSIQNAMLGDSEPETVFSIVKGQVGFRFDRLSGKEPRIRSGNAVAGIRGTEFTVVSGTDGRSLFVISDGLVEVRAGSAGVNLSRMEAVEVSLDRGLGERFAVLEDEINFTDWRTQADAAAFENPGKTLSDMTGLLMEYLDNAEHFWNSYREADAELQRLGDMVIELREEGATDEADEIVQQEYQPLKTRALHHGLNYRYYALSAVNLRRHVVSSLYVHQRTSAWGEPLPGEFRSAYREFTRLYEERLIRYLTDADI